jgi:copper chaperone CopZ
MKSELKLLIAQLIVLAQLFAAPGTVLAQGSGAPQPDTTTRATLQVRGMIGETCPVLIESALKRLDGVRHVQASYAEHSATIDYDAQRVSLDQIRRTIRRDAGFETELAH